MRDALFRLSWFAAHWWHALLIAAVIGGLFIVGGALSLRGKTVPVTAEVVRFGTRDSNWHFRRPQVIVRTADGRTHQLPTSEAEMATCRRGSAILLRRGERGLSVDPLGCRVKRSDEA